MWERATIFEEGKFNNSLILLTEVVALEVVEELIVRPRFMSALFDIPTQNRKKKNHELLGVLYNVGV